MADGGIPSSLVVKGYGVMTIRNGRPVRKVCKEELDT